MKNVLISYLLLELIPNISFEWCDVNCQTCSEIDPTICLTCQTNDKHVSNTKCVCNDGLYPDSNNKCQQCNITCLTCSNQNICTSCNSSLNRIFNTSQNTCDCQSGYYSQPSQSQCVKCPYNCQTCSFNTLSNSVICLSCNQDAKYNRSTSGNCSCLSGYYDDGTNIQCQTCNYSCKECINATTCTNCPSGSFRQVVNSNQSSCVCQSGYYDDGVNQICLKCPYNCQTCQKQGVSIVCTSCNLTDTFRQTDQLCSCSSGYYDAGQPKCKQCNNGCTSCDQQGKCQAGCSISCIFCSSSTVCNKCQTLTYLVNNQCVNSCSTNQFADNTNQKCVDCPANCNQCQLDPSKCQICSTGLVIYQDLCQASCPSGYYIDQNNICQQCQSNCQVCDSNGGCSLCQNGTYLFQNKQCLSSCPDLYYLETSTNSCQQCMTNCDKCISQNQCSKCSQNYFLLNNNQCISSCPSSYYSDASLNECQQCVSSCLSCSKSNQCNQCATGTYLFKHQQCLTKCPNGYYVDTVQNKCRECSTKYCSVCSNQDQCTQCQTGYLQKQNYCVMSCGSGYQAKDNICTVCAISNCDQCQTNVNECSTCLFGYEIFNGECMLVCLQNQVRDSSGQCQDFKQYTYTLKDLSNNKIAVIFAAKLNLQEISDKIKITLEQQSQTSKYEISVLDDQTLQIAIIPKKSIDQKINVKISIVDSSYSFLEPNQSIQIKISQKQEDSNPAATETLQTATQTIATATVSAIFPLALTGNFWMISSILDISQIIYMTTFIDFETTTILDKFLSSQKDFKLPFPNIFEKIPHYEEVDYETPPKIYENDIQGFFLSNMGDTLSLLLMIFGVKFVLQGIILLFKKFKKIHSPLSKIYEKLFPSTLFLDLQWSMYQDLSFSVVVQLITFHSVIYDVEILNYAIFPIGLIVTVSPLLLAYLVHSNRSEKITKHITKDLTFNYYQILLYFRKFFYTVIIGTLQTSPYAEIILIIIFHLIFLIMLIRVKPFEVSFLNYKDIAQSLLFLISHILILVVYTFSDQGNSVNIIIFSWVILVLFALIILIEVILIFREIYIAIKDTYQKCRKNKLKNLTVVPIQEKQTLSKEPVNEKERYSFSKRIEEKQEDQEYIGGLESPTKFESRVLISHIMDQKDSSVTQIKSNSSPRFNRRLRQGKRYIEVEANNQAQSDNYNISSMLRFQQNQSQNLIEEPETNRDYRNLQSSKTPSTLMEDQSESNYPHSINEENYDQVKFNKKHKSSNSSQ